jgi:C4-dicarboxylate transporter DctQ subunit
MLKILDRLEEWIMSLMLLAMTALAFMQVVRRYIFNTNFSWDLELTKVCGWVRTSVSTHWSS